eukprot:TRINITY_DN553_c0_g1_i4.p1 TRINITY_DN553_c0_g1~~TRINITY_DN553_c0_g1_i4.p1  ORF type:complete len:326 (+),score=32.71 TRINITY_DN553_c0_g1_i4:357-1334(+)
MITANFDSTLKTLSTLFQLMVGEAWSSVMYAGIDAVGMMSMVYFILWTLIISLLFTNLIVGIVCNSFEKVDDLRKKKGEDRISTREMADSLKDSSLSSMIRFLKVNQPLDPDDPVELIRTLTPDNVIESLSAPSLYEDGDMNDVIKNSRNRRSKIRQSIFALAGDRQRILIEESRLKRECSRSDLSAKDVALRRRNARMRYGTRTAMTAPKLTMNPMQLVPSELVLSFTLAQSGVTVTIQFQISATIHNLHWSFTSYSFRVLDHQTLDQLVISGLKQFECFHLASVYLVSHFLQIQTTRILNNLVLLFSFRSIRNYFFNLCLFLC